MKSKMLSCFIMTLALVFATVAMADFVDIGDLVSESGHNLVGWGPIEPANSGGNFGGIDHCRTAWSSSDNNTWATVDLTFTGSPVELVSFKHLKGIADDSFEVFLDGTLKYTFSDTEITTNEAWYVNGFNVYSISPGVHTLKFVATGTQWSSWGSYGQVAIAEAGVGDDAPVPAEPSSWGSVKSLFR